QAEGVQVLLIGQKRKASPRSRISRLSAECDLSVAEALERDLDGLVVPGDWAADKMRTNRSFLEIVQKQFNNGRLLASIAEGHSVLISAKILEGMKVAGLPEMKRDIENCGACQVDQPVYQDKNLVTSRCTDDLPELMRWVLGYLKAR
ncbi:MAG: DJ-1/PfpI family protein, partial [Candidatus Neomarinimicrobiota bacterium]